MDLLDALLDPLRSGLDRRALLELVLLGAFCGGLGFWVVSERLSYGAESLSHGLLPGLVLAALAGAPLLVGAGAGAATAAALIAVAGGDERLGPDAATGLVVTGMVGLGGLLALAPDAPQRLEELLFGDPLGVDDADLAAAATLLVVGSAALGALHRPFCALGFDPAGAFALGLPSRATRLALLALLAAAIAVAAKALGALLVLALLVAPPVAVRRHASGPAGAMLAGGAVGALGGIGGIYLSFHAGSAAGASVALVLCLAAVLGSLGGLRRAAP